MTVEQTNIVSKKAETKKDGVYKYKDWLYAVKKGRFVLYIHKGQVLQRMGSFNAVLGNCDKTYDYEKKEVLKSLLKKIE
jgi:hypothetical protein